MSFKVTIGGGEFEIAKECVKKVVYSTDIPLDADARTKDVGSSLIISGKILTAVDGDPFDSTGQLSLWSLIPAEEADCYKKVEIEHIAAGKTVRTYEFPNAFVVKYEEDYGNTDGVGIFTLTVKQKKDKMANISITGF